MRKTPALPGPVGIPGREEGFPPFSRGKRFVIGLTAPFVSVLAPLGARTVQHFSQSLFRPGKILGVFLFYLCQMIIGLGFFRVLTGRRFFQLEKPREDMARKVEWVRGYLALWSFAVLVFYGLSHRFNPDFPAYVSRWWTLDGKAFLDDLLTTCLQSGIFEEVFFRGIVARLILLSAAKPYDRLTGEMKLFLVIVNGVLFSAAHVYYGVFPLVINPLDFTQLLSTFVVGSVMTYFYYRSGSVLGPILAHTGGNVIQVLTGYAYAYWISGV